MKGRVLFALKDGQLLVNLFKLIGDVIETANLVLTSDGMNIQGLSSTATTMMSTHVNVEDFDIYNVGDSSIEPLGVSISHINMVLKMLPPKGALQFNIDDTPASKLHIMMLNEEGLEYNVDMNLMTLDVDEIIPSDSDFAIKCAFEMSDFRSGKCFHKFPHTILIL